MKILDAFLLIDLLVVIASIAFSEGQTGQKISLIGLLVLAIIVTVWRAMKEKKDIVVLQ